MKCLIIVAIVAALIVPVAECAAAPSAESLIGLARKNFAAIRDYSVDIRLDVQSEALAVKGMAMTLYYKKPDKTRIVAKEGFAAMPRSLTLGNVIDEITKHSVPFLVRQEKLNGVDCYKIRLDPNSSSNQPRTRLWLDKSGLIRAIKVDGPYPVSTEWHYGKVDEKFYLPRQITARISTPAGSPYRHQPSNAGAAGRGARGPQAQTGSAVQTVNATLSFSNYKVNKGISDSVFAPEKQPTQKRK